MGELNLELDHTYLLQYGVSDTVSSATVLIISDKAYRIRWNRSTESNDTWELKERFSRSYSIVEDITDIMKKTEINMIFSEPKPPHLETKMIQCNYCNGLGNIPDSRSSSGTGTCPKCMGAKETIEYRTVIS